MTQSKEEKIVKDAPFEVAPFDEKAFIRKELISFKTTVVLFFFALLVAGISYVIWSQAPEFAFFLHVVIALGIAFAGLRFVYKLTKFDISHWKRKEWVGTYLLFFLFWMGFFLLLVNPPITDAVPPSVEHGVSPAHQAPGHPIELGAYISDNSGVDAASLVFCVAPKQEDALPDLDTLQERGCGAEWERPGRDPFWRTTFVAAEPGEYWWAVHAADVRGQSTLQHGILDVSNPFRVIEPPRESQFVVSGDALRVRVQDGLDVRVVQFSLDGGTAWTNFARDPDPARAAEGWWITDPSFEGWRHGSFEVHVRAIENPTFLTHGQQVGGAIVADPDGPYNVTVSQQLRIVGERAPPEFPEPRYQHPGMTPGLGLPAIVAVVAVLAFAWRRRA